MKFATKSQQHNRARPWWRAIHLRSKFLSNPVVWDFDSNLWATSSPGLFPFFKGKALGKRFISEATGKREKNVQLTLQHCWKKKLLKSDVALFTTHVQTCLVSNQVVASCLNTDFWLDKIARDSRHIRDLRHLLQKEFAFGFSLCSVYRFCWKSRANHYFLQKRFVTCNNLVVARQVWLRGW